MKKLTLLAIAVGVVLAVQPGAAKVKVRADFDKAFDFRQVHTWGWNPERGQVLLALSASDDPEAVRQRVEPLIVSSVNAEMPKRGLTMSATSPAVTLTYFLLLSIGTSAQTLGQFLPSTVNWGLPPFHQSTTSLELMQQGSLVLDANANGQIVWRGVANASIDMGLEQHKRDALIREAVKKLLEEFPPKQK